MWAYRVRAAVSLCLLLVVAGLLYRPWEWRPLGIVDAAEYISVARAGSGVADKFQRLTTYYASRYGRFNPIVFAAIAAQSSVFAGSATGWYWARFATMAAVVVMAYLALRRLGISAAGAAAAAALFVCSGPAAEAWFLLSIGEPIGTLLLTVALWTAAGYRSSSEWVVPGAVIVACTTAAVLAKEMLVCAVPLILVISACHVGGGQLTPPFRSRRSVALLIACSVAVGAVGLLVLSAARLPRATFPTKYALSNVGSNSLARFGAALLPVSPSASAERWPAIVANSLFVLILWLGLRPGFVAGPERRRTELGWVGVALLTPFVGTVLYAPWPYEMLSYFLPMLIGSGILFGRATSAAFEQGGSARAGASVACLSMLAVAGGFAWRSARYSDVPLRVSDAAVRAALSARGVETMIITVPNPTPTSWERFWPWYARAFYGRDLPPVVLVKCRATQIPTGKPVLMVSSVPGCGALRSPTLTRVEYFTHFDWARLRPTRDSIRFDLRCDVPRGSAQVQPPCVDGTILR
jgi:hypothetical protein